MSVANDPRDNTPGGGLDAELVEWVAELADRVQAGGCADLDEFVARNPDRADELRRMLPAIEAMVGLAGRPAGMAPPVATVLPPPGPYGGPDFLGDFQILRELGRGGMGIVYEARQLSLNRRVALKVLPATSALDARQLQRFRLETQAVACLNHPNVVPVFSVGRDKGVPYYAMPLIEGRSLAEVIRDLRRLDHEGGDPEKTQSEAPRWDSGHDFAPLTPLDPVLSSITRVVPDGPERPAPPSPPPGHRSGPVVANPQTRKPAFFRTVAKLGRQAAEALAHAHQQGVLHRDVKPANLLVDARGDLWVTDFGLARLQGDSDVTLTGDIVGTLRYMSPEQALGRRASIDHRTDVYSLGVTLYELITLRPAFEGAERHDVLRRIASDDPPPPRSFNPSIPADLETIVLKAMAKEPADRYGAAADLAEDLCRFLEHRPVLASRPGLVDRAAKWARRHRPAVAAGLTLVVMAVAGLAVAGWWTSVWLRGHNLTLSAERDRADRYAREARWQQSVAERRAWLATRRLIASQTRQAQDALTAGHVERAQELLQDVVSEAGGGDPRGFAWQYLWRLARRDFDLLCGHESAVHALAIAPDGTTLATGDDQGIVILWDLGSRRRLATVKVTPGRIVGLAFAADGSDLAVLDQGRDGSPGTLALWDLAPDGTDGGRPRLGRRWVLSGDGRVRSMVRTTEGAHLITSEGDGVLRWRRTSDGGLEESRPGSGRRALSIARTPDGKTLAVGTGGLDFRLVDLATGRETARFDCPATGDPLALAAGFSPDGRVLAMLTIPTRCLALRDVAGRRDLPAPALPPRRLFGLAFSPDGSTVALGGTDPSLRLWDFRAGRECSTSRGYTRTVLALGYASGGRELVVACEDPSVRLWHVARRSDPPDPSGHRAEAWSVAFTPDGRTLATAGDDHLVKLWDVATGREVCRPRPHGSLVTSIAFSRDGRTLVSGSFDRSVRVWEAATGRHRRTLSGHASRVRAVAVSPDGRTIASGGTDRLVRLWDAETGAPRAALEGHTDLVRALAFSPDGRHLVSAGNDHTVRVWDPARAAPVRTMTGRDEVTSVSFSSDGRSLAAADRTGVVTVWDVTTGERRATLKGPANEARAVAFSPDGGVIAAGYDDRTVRLWDLVAGQEVLVLKGHANKVNSVAFSPDGSTLASCDHDGAVRLWRAAPR